jgi:hypothetical protein
MLRIKESFDLELATANSGGLVPMYLSLDGGAIVKANLGDALAPSPPSAAVRLPQPIDFPNSGARGDGLDV